MPISPSRLASTLPPLALLAATSCVPAKKASEVAENRPPAPNETLLARAYSEAQGPQEIIESFFEREFGELQGKFARIGKVTVRLWHDDPNHPERSEFPEFLPPASASYLQTEFRNAVAGQNSAWEFLGCSTSQALALAGKPALPPGPEAAEACGFLVNKPQEGRLRQFEFYIAKGAQTVYVTTDVFQRAAAFRQKTSIAQRLTLLTRPDSWAHELDLIHVKSAPLDGSENDKLAAEGLKAALKLFNLPSSLEDASTRWSDKQRNVEARKPVVGATLSAAGAVLGAAQIAAGVSALTTASAAAGGSVLATTGATATQTVSTAAAAWKIVSGLAFAASSAADLAQTQRIIDLEGNPERRANLQFSYAVFRNTTRVIGLLDLVVSSRALFEQVTRNYINSRVAASLAAQKTADQMELINLQAQARQGGVKLLNDGFDLVTGTLQAPAKVGMNVGFLQYMKDMSTKWYQAGRLTRTVLHDTLQARELAKALATRPDTYYTGLMKEVVDNGVRASMEVFTRLNAVSQGARGIALVAPEIERQIHKATYEVHYRILTDPAP